MIQCRTGKVRANLQSTFFPLEPKKYFRCDLRDWQDATASKKTQQPVFTIHSYDFSAIGSPHTFSLKAKLTERFSEKKRTPALFVFTPLPHSPSTMRLLYNDVHCADSTYDPDFPSFVINSTTDYHRNLAFSTKEDDLDGSKALSSTDVIFILRDVGDADDRHDVGTEIGRYTTSIEAAKNPMMVKSTRGDHGKGDQLLNPVWWLRPPVTLVFETSPGIFTKNPNAMITYLSCVPTASIEDRCVRNAIFNEAAHMYRKSIIDTLYQEEKSKTCFHELCPYKDDPGRCLNLENMGLHDGDLEEIFR